MSLLRTLTRIPRSVARELMTGNTARAQYESAGQSATHRAQVDGYPRNHDDNAVQSVRRHHLETLLREVREARNLLDVGCGTGMYLEQMAQRFADVQLFGVDISQPTLQNYTAKAVPTASLALCDVAHEVPFAGTQFDLIYSIAVLQHVHPIRLQGFVNNLYQAAGPGARVILTFPPGRDWQEQWAMRGFYRYTPARIHQALARAGFRQVSVEPMDPANPGLGYVARAMR